MEKVTLTKIYTTDKDKQGNPLKSKKGFPYTRMSIKTAEHGDKWISGFKNKDNEGWKEGDSVEIIITQNGEYLNFDVPKKEDMLNDDMQNLKFRVSILEDLVKELRKLVVTDEVKSKIETEKNGYKYPTPEDAGIDESRPSGEPLDNF